MAAAYTFPATLPVDPVTNDYSETMNINIIRTPMELGVAKQRRRSTMPTVFTLSYIYTDANLATLQTFVYDTIQGVRRFNFTHPRTKEAIEARIVPQSGGQMYKIIEMGVNNYIVSMTLEELP